MDDNKTDKDKKLTNSNHNKTSDNEEDIQNYFNNIEIPKELSMSVRKGIEKGKKEKQYNRNQIENQLVLKNHPDQGKDKSHKGYKKNNIFKIACSITLLVTVSLVALKFGTSHFNKVNLKNNLNDKVALVESNKEELKLPKLKDEAEFKEILASIVKQNRDIYMSFADDKQSVKGGELKVDEGKTQSSDFSKTNIQVDGVDEGDVAKTDGEYIYSVKNSHDFKRVANVGIVKTQNPNDMALMSQLNIEGYVEELYITKNKLIIISKDYKHNDITNIYIYNKEDIKNLKLERKLQYDSSYVSGRMLGDNLVIVLNKVPYFTDNKVDVNEALPKYYDSLKDKKVVTDPKDIKYCPGTERQSIITIGSIDVENSQGEIKLENIFASSNNIYCSKDNLYVVGSTQLSDVGMRKKSEQESVNTSIYKFSLLQGNIKLVARGEVKGRPLNQFSMDEKGVYFRIVTTNGGRDNSTNNLYILDNDLNEVGKLEGLAPKEKVYSVRFIDNTAYMVTFKQIDPLFVIDMRNEKNPKVKGELKIPGFSSYLHPLDKDTLIGFGEQRDEKSTEKTGLKLSIFNVSDETTPKESFTLKLGDSSSYSEVSNSHKAFFIDKERGVIGIPIKSYNRTQTISNVYLIKVSKEEGFQRLGEIRLKSESYLDRIRIMYIGENLYIVSNDGISSYDIKDLKCLGQIKY